MSFGPHAVLQGVRCVVLIAVMATTILARDESAWAGTYSVAQCDFALGIPNSAFTWDAAGTPSPVQQTGSGCTELGLAVRTPNVGTAQTYPPGTFAGYFASAPPDTRIRQFSGMFGTLSNCCTADLISRVVASQHADGSGLQATIAETPFSNSTWPAASGSLGPVLASWSSTDAGFEAGRIGYYIACAPMLSCSQNSTGELRMRARSFAFSVEDLVTPTVDAVGGSLLLPEWIRGIRTLSASASDAGGGLAALTAQIGTEVSVESQSDCQKVGNRYVALRPCPLDRDATWSIDTTELPDGESTLIVSATDVGDATADTATPVLIDNTPPGPPDMDLGGGSGWSASRDFDLHWDASEGQHSPIARIHYELCSVDPPTTCEAETEPAAAADFRVSAPQAGTYRLDVWLEDAAGNGDRDTAQTLHLQVDDAQPAPASIAPVPGWLGSSTAATASLEISGPLNEPASGIAGFSVTTDGSAPDETIDLEGSSASYPLGALAEGTTEVAARAISGAGVGSETVTASVSIDRSPPSAEVAAMPPAGVWLNHPISVQVKGTDQAWLSGMLGAPAGAPLAAGAYVDYAIDAGSPIAVRGNEATVVVSSDGRHEIVVRARDAAGNFSAPSSWSFKIDQTDPTGSFDRQDPGDPRKVSVSVSDALSGVDGGHVELRKVGGKFVGLPTSRAGGKLVARFDDLALTRGEYEFRAIVDDVAGNRAVISQRVDGRPMALDLPVRTPTALSAEVRGATRRCTVARKHRKRARRPKKKCRTVTGGNSAAFGKGFASHGQLTGLAGRPLGGATILIEGQPRSGGPFVRLGTARTDTAGHFRFALPAGPSRNIRYRYGGTNTALPASATRSTKVAAAARLSVDRRRVRNGQAVVFKGRLLGKPIPKAGKLVALQAKVGRGWRTFATPRANSRGVFKRRYRFTSTTGVRRYAFRALVTREAAYPYERGTSRTVRVTVRGR